MMIWAVTGVGKQRTGRMIFLDSLHLCCNVFLIYNSLFTPVECIVRRFQRAWFEVEP